MASTTRSPTAEVRWYGEELEAAVRALMYERLDRTGQYLAAQMRQNLSGPSPSSPGEYPGLSSGELRDSIDYEVDYTEMTVRVGSHSPYALSLEYGTSGGKVITAEPGKVFSWLDPMTGERVFTRRIRLGRIRPRPFLRRTVLENYDRISRILTQRVEGLGRPQGLVLAG